MEDRQDQIKFGSSVLYLSEAEVQLQMNKEVVFELCQQRFTCKPKLSLHRKEVHKLEERFNCSKCEKVFKKLKLMKKHMAEVHKTPNFKCMDCGKLSKLRRQHERHMQIHESSKRKPFSTLKKTQLLKRSKKEAQKIKKVLFDAPDGAKKTMWDNIIKDCPYYMNKLKENALTEEEVIELIKDNNLSDRQVVNICKFLKEKWGQETITPNISRKLTKRKSILDQFFTFKKLDAKSKYCFKTKNGKSISRSVTYCHDLPGLIAWKKLMENIDDDQEIMNVIGVDDGKKILKIVWNFSYAFKNDKGKYKLMGPKRSVVLAAVSKLKETHHNICVFMKLTNLNEVEYAFSMDLKLVNISIGIQSHGSRY